MKITSKNKNCQNTRGKSAWEEVGECHRRQAGKVCLSVLSHFANRSLQIKFWTWWQRLGRTRMKIIQSAISHLRSVSRVKMCICHSKITEGGEKKTSRVLKVRCWLWSAGHTQMSPPEAVFWSEHLKWVQWTAQLVTFRIMKVTLFKKATLLQNERISGTECSAAPEVATQTRPRGVASWSFFSLTLLRCTSSLTFCILTAACISAWCLPLISVQQTLN